MNSISFSGSASTATEITLRSAHKTTKKVEPQKTNPVVDNFDPLADIGSQFYPPTQPKTIPAPQKLPTYNERLERFKEKRDELEKETGTIIPDELLINVFERYPWVSDDDIHDALHKRISKAFPFMVQHKKDGKPHFEAGEPMIFDESGPTIKPNSIMGLVLEKYPFGFSDEGKLLGSQHRLSMFFPIIKKSLLVNKTNPLQAQALSVRPGTIAFNKYDLKHSPKTPEKKIAGSRTLTLDHVNHLFPKTKSFIPPLPASNSGIAWVDTSIFPRLQKTSGNEELKDFFNSQIVTPYRYPILASYKEPQVVILHGPQGGGKTFSVGCMIEEWKRQTGQQGVVYVTSASQFRQKWVGDSRGFIETLLNTGKDLHEGALRVLFIDEAELSKEGESGNDEVRREINSTLKKLLDGLETKAVRSPHRTVVVFATNYIDTIEKALQSRATLIHVPGPTAKSRNQVAKTSFKKMRLLLPIDCDKKDFLQKISEMDMRQLGDFILELRNKSVQYLMENRAYAPERKRITDRLKKETKQKPIPKLNFDDLLTQVDEAKAQKVTSIKLSTRLKKNLRRKAQRFEQQAFLEELVDFDMTQSNPYTAIVRLYPNRYAHLSHRDARIKAAKEDRAYAIDEMQRIREKREEKSKQTKFPKIITVEPNTVLRQRVIDTVTSFPKRGNDSYDPKNAEHREKRATTFKEITRFAIREELTGKQKRERSNKANPNPRLAQRLWLPVPKNILENTKPPKKPSNDYDTSHLYG